MESNLKIPLIYINLADYKLNMNEQKADYSARKW